jgi:4-hydroxy-4-methyl-2-oxoglutarate aldolase
MDLNSTERITELTSRYEGERSADGRPRVGADILERMLQVTTEEAWGVLNANGFQRQFEGDWVNLHPERVLVGRAVTCRYVPHRPDLNEVIQEEGEAHGRVGGQNSWVIDTLEEGDVLVVDLFGKIDRGTFIGDNLGTAIATRTGGTGLIVDGSIRDTQRVRQLPMNVFAKGLHPSGIGDVTMTEINGPIRIGQATVMPGDVILGTSSGVIFVPPQLAEQVVDDSENTRLRDYWGKMTISNGTYTPGEVDRGWTDAMNAEFAAWKEGVDPTSLEI